MGVQHDEALWARQISDEVMDDRKKAIEAAGPLLNASRTTQLREILHRECRITDDNDVNNLIGAFAAAGSDDEVDVREAISSTLSDAVKQAFKISNPNAAFIRRSTASIFSVVNEAMTERDANIVRGGGPAKPKFMQRHYS